MPSDDRMKSPGKNPNTRKSLPPVDFSFHEVRELKDIIGDEPNDEFGTPVVATLKIERQTIVLEDADAAKTHKPGSNENANDKSGTSTDTQIERKFVTNTLKLNGNFLRSLEGLREIETAILHEPDAIEWLDVSCNELAHISPIICQHPNLSLLYLHGNKISNIRELRHLKPLGDQLRSITLHGNTLVNDAQYKNIILNLLPNLRTLDFSSVISVDMERAEKWAKTPQGAHCMTAFLRGSAGGTSP